MSTCSPNSPSTQKLARADAGQQPRPLLPQPLAYSDFSILSSEPGTQVGTLFCCIAHQMRTCFFFFSFCLSLACLTSQSLLLSSSFCFLQKEILQGLHSKLPNQNSSEGFPGSSVAKKSACQCRRHGFDPWSRKIPHCMEQLSPGATTTEPAL